MPLEIPLPVVVLGTVIGITYGLLAIGLVLVYRTNRIINFAHGDIGAFGAAVFGLSVTTWRVPYYVSLPLALALGGAVAAGAEVAVVRRLRHAPRLMSVVATLGVGAFLLQLSGAVNAQAQTGHLYPQPPGVPVFRIGALLVTPAFSAMLILGPLLVAGIALFLRFSRWGLGIRSAAANPDSARTSGIFAGRMSSLAWALAGALSTFTAILVAPSRGFETSAAFGPALLLRALAGAVLARMTSLPVALAAGVSLGVVEQVLLWNYPRGGLVELTLFVIILAALLVQRRGGMREEERGSWAAVQPWPPLPDAVRRVWTIRNLGRMLGVAMLGVAVAIAFLVPRSVALGLTLMMGLAAIGLSVGIVTGLGGQLSLGQVAVAGVGAVASFRIATQTGNFPLAIVGAGVAAAAVSLLIGLPALRLRGLMLTVTTLGFALVSGAWLFQQPWMLGAGVDPGRPIVAGRALEGSREYYFFALAVFVLVVLLTHNLRRGGFGRLLVATRDNEDGARAFTVAARTVKMQGFLAAGFIAGVGGAIYGHALAGLGPATFPVSLSVTVVAMAVIGGIGILAGPIIGALYIVGVPQFVPLDAAGLAATAFGWLILILYAPGGIAQILRPVRDRLVGALARRAGVDLPAESLRSVGSEDSLRDGTPRTEAAAGALAPIATPDGPRTREWAGALLEGIDLQRSFGGVRAVEDVSIEVQHEEIVGLIGPNGAGKTTLFELLSGFIRPDHGRVVFAGTDVSSKGPEARGRLGLIRSFQDAALFPTMTVLDVVKLALERVNRTSVLLSAAGIPSRERARDAAAREIVSFMGLDPWRHAQVRELSTGTRRITELACMVAVRPTLLLLDEPSSGIAQRETEALGGLLLNIKHELDLSLLIIEHDIPLIMGLADRIVAMDAGHVIATGRPEDIRTNPAVVEAYLGGSPEAIERSGRPSDKAAGRDVPAP